MSITLNSVAIENHRIPKKIITDEININENMRPERKRTGEAIPYSFKK